MNGQIDELYLRWLYRNICPISVKNPADTYWSFARQLFKKEFIWLVSNDDNRSADGRALREEFVDEYNLIDVDPLWMNLGCSMLEMLVALSRRLSFLIELEQGDCFWILIENLDIGACDDRAYKNDRDKQIDIDVILDIVIWRNYHYSGAGGLFPLDSPKRDQRTTEIWYQMSAWVIENGEDE